MNHSQISIVFSIHSTLLLLLYFLSASGVNGLLAKRKTLVKFIAEKNATFGYSDLVEEISKLTDRFSIMEALTLENRILVKKPPLNDSEISIMMRKIAGQKIMCSGNTFETRKDVDKMVAKIEKAIFKTLNFYGNHLDTLHFADYATSLGTLKAVDDRNAGRLLGSRYPITQWISRICENTKTGPGPTLATISCEEFTKAFMSRDQEWTTWLPEEDIASGEIFQNLGKEKETIFSILNHDCLEAVLTRCEVPHVCERVMFDENPGSQYALTHQLLIRMFAQLKMESCNLPSRLVDEKINRQFCRKMLQEAELIAYYEDPFIFSDLFAEQMEFCGFIGYPNFFREDWLNMILSWQSKSDYGCFLKDTKSHFMTSDWDIPRRITTAEKELGIVSTDEICHPHFTTVSLGALSVAWDYLQNKCA